MRKAYPMKKNKPLKDNVKVILPLMYDDFMSYKDRVVNHPRLKMSLHRMRIKGKPMRYLMEYVEHAFSQRFRGCLEEIKNIIEMMGEIHDCDANIPELTIHLNELRQFNRNVRTNAKKFLLKPIIALIKEMRNERNDKYSKFCETLNKWEKEDFRSKLVTSMIEPPRRLRG
jgi:CHAD domain-containing protein